METTWQNLIRFLTAAMLCYVVFQTNNPMWVVTAIAMGLGVDLLTATPPTSKSEWKQKNKKISIVVPTYEEKDNLEELCNRIHAACSKANLVEEIIIVDDNSNDGSVEVVSKLVKNGIPVEIIVRTKERGLSSAVMCGFEKAKNQTLVCMDADLSHPPEVLPEIVKHIMNGNADFVIGSRYAGGGRSEHNFIRWVISMGASLLAFPLVPTIRDPMSGFFSMPAHVVKYTKGVNSKGFKIGLELVVKAAIKPNRAKEVPIVFKDRVKGVSKLTMKVQAFYVTQLIDLYLFALPSFFVLSLFSGLKLVWVAVPFLLNSLM